MFQKHNLPLDNRYNHGFRQTLRDTFRQVEIVGAAMEEQVRESRDEY